MQIESTHFNAATGETVTVWEDGVSPTESELLTAWRATAKVSAFQAKAALLDAGLLADIEIIVGQAGPLAALAWEYAAEFQRLSPTIASLVASAGLTDTELDDLFRAAAQITA